MQRDIGYTDLRYRKPRCRMKAKYNTKPGKIKIFTRSEIEAYIQTKAEETTGV
jgi:hypothetical protein